jgi:septum site-determining protein MinC
VTAAPRPRHSIRFRGRSFLATVLAPEPPLADWIAELDAWGQRSPGFFAGRAVILDVSALSLGKAEFAGLLSDLHTRDIRIMAVEGADPSILGLGMPPAVHGGRDAASIIEVPRGKSAPAAPTKLEPNSLLLDSPVRSGQAVVHPKGDVIVIGSVASGAEIVAGGSIHIYGALRGRAIAGSANPRARIFCRKFEAELVAIDGLYKASDDIDPHLRGRAVQAWLDGDALIMAALD